MAARDPALVADMKNIMRIRQLGDLLSADDWDLFEAIEAAYASDGGIGAAVERHGLTGTRSQSIEDVTYIRPTPEDSARLAALVAKYDRSSGRA